MNTTPTPVERAARALRKHALAAAPSSHCICGEAEWTPEHEARAAAEALLSDVDEIARVICASVGAVANVPCEPCRNAARALSEHLTGATR